MDICKKANADTGPDCWKTIMPPTNAVNTTVKNYTVEVTLNIPQLIDIDIIHANCIL